MCMFSRSHDRVRKCTRTPPDASETPLLHLFQSWKSSPTSTRRFRSLLDTHAAPFDLLYFTGVE